MPDLDDEALLTAERESLNEAVLLLQECWGRTTRPRHDSRQVLRLGYGRAIETREQSERAATLELTEDVMQAQETLRGRFFELLTVHPEMRPSLPYIIAIADIIGAEAVRGNSELWAAARKGDWVEFGSIIQEFRWDYFSLSTERDKRAVSRLVMKLVMGASAGAS
ncbi:hypothetical protein AB8813_09040 [Xanthomonas arboricola pv. corylina]|uniref:hypothetical protein n=1 Tax=Xanthomonas TaxID=338 RepID=UPI000CEF4F98|nr:MULTISPECIES: hypothetical protein [Xanthomonas]MBB5737210.1 hypothetical protein [Xanthomonas sp. CFBP 8152]PPT80523.1 hypothetical protein XarbCFBP8152_04650 [Xanthomonas arboricola]PPU60029.1 hypothetical protein XacyCFBP1159_13290 [Xanthomonas arboricola pv. corylina]